MITILYLLESFIVFGIVGIVARHFEKKSERKEMKEINASMMDGSITLPEEVKQALDVKPGDNIVFIVNPNGTVYLEKD